MNRSRSTASRVRKVRAEVNGVSPDVRQAHRRVVRTAVHKRIAGAGAALIVGLALAAAVRPAQTLTGTAPLVLKPTPTLKVCHMCDDEVAPAATPTVCFACDAVHPVKLTAMTASPTTTSESHAPIVHLAMFWMPGCPACEEVIQDVLPTLKAEHGSRLDVLLIEVATQEDVDRLFALAADLGIPKEQTGVPFLIIGDRLLVGSMHIGRELPGLIDASLAQGGVGLLDHAILASELTRAVPFGLSQTQPAETRTPAVVLPGDNSEECGVATPCVDEPMGTPGASLVFLTDPPAPAVSAPDGFGLAAAVLSGMVAALIFVGARAWRVIRSGSMPPSPAPTEMCRAIALPALAVVGLGVAGYLAYVETQMVEAACGPVGDCNAVQTSSYARLFGVLPLGVLGMVGYGAMLLGWAWGRLRADRMAQLAPIAVFGMALFGTLFSIYLTYVELFVLRAVCIWCIISAVVMVLLLLLSLDPVLRHLVEMPDDEEETA